MKELDLTRGSVPKVLLKFAMPFLLANCLQALYGGADLFVVGWFDDAASVSGVAVGSQVMQTITGAILSLASGATILIATATGAKDHRKVAETIGTSICFFGIVALAVTVAMVLLHEQVALAMHTPVEAMRDTTNYILICSLGIPFIFGYNVVCGIMRGLGDSKSPLYFVGLACAINIVMDFVLVGGFGLRAAGAAAATVMSQGVSFLTALWWLHRTGFSFEFRRSDIKINGQLNFQIVKLGGPLALQDALINVSFLLITVIVNGMGVVASAALGVVEKIIIFAMLPPFAISSAVATMTAQNYGAGILHRMTKCLVYGIASSLAIGLAVCAYSQFWPETLTGLFTKDAAVIEMAAGYLRGYSIDCVLVAFVFNLNSFFIGQGNSWFTMAHGLAATFLFRIPLSYLAGQLHPHDLVLMGYAIPLSTLVSVIACFVFLHFNLKKLHVDFGQGRLHSA